MKTLNYLASFIVLSVMISSCSKESASSNSSSLSSSFSVQMIEDPMSYDAVYLDIQAVEVTSDNGSKVMLKTHSDVYNLADPADGKETVIANGELDMKKVEHIRLILGSKNSVVMNNVSYPLVLPTDQVSLDLPVDKPLVPGASESVLVGLELTKMFSTHEPMHFQPVLRAVDASLTGSIKGQIVPSDVRATVKIITKGRMIYSSVSSSGYFRMRGLQPGMYSITVLPPVPFSPVTMKDISVEAGTIDALGVIRLNDKISNTDLF